MAAMLIAHRHWASERWAFTRRFFESRVQSRESKARKIKKNKKASIPHLWLSTLGSGLSTFFWLSALDFSETGRLTPTAQG
jgi:hypothetical protein